MSSRVTGTAGDGDVSKVFDIPEKCMDGLTCVAGLPNSSRGDALVLSIYSGEGSSSAPGSSAASGYASTPQVAAYSGSVMS